MKTIFTPLKHPKTILIVIIFFTLFLVFSLIAPAQTALGKGDEDFDPPTGNSSSGGGTSNDSKSSDSKSSSGGSGSSNNNSQKDEDQNPNAGGGGSSGGSSNSKDKGEKDNSQSGGGGSTSGGSSNNNSQSNDNDHNDSNGGSPEVHAEDWKVTNIPTVQEAEELANLIANSRNIDCNCDDYVPSVSREGLFSGAYTATATKVTVTDRDDKDNNNNDNNPPIEECHINTGDGCFFTYYPPTATISATNCTIASGASTCNANLTWNIEDATNPNVRNTTSGETLFYATGTSVPQALIYGQNTIVARDSTTVLATTFANATCASGSVWIGTKCGPKTDLNPVSPTITPQCTTTDSPCPTSTVSFTIYNAGAPISAGTNVPYRIEYKENGSNVWQTAVNGNWSGGLAYPGTTPPINNTFSLDLPYGNHKVRVVVNLSPSNNPSIGEVNFSNNISNELGLSKSPDPVQLEFRADNDVIRYNTPATLKYQIVAPYDVSCIITGPVEGSIIINHTAGDNSVYPITSLKLTNQQKFTITCPDTAVNGFTAPGVRKDVIMEVVPVVWEV